MTIDRYNSSQAQFYQIATLAIPLLLQIIYLYHKLKILEKLGKKKRDMIGLKKFFLLIAVCSSLSIMLISAVEEEKNSASTREHPPYGTGEQVKIIRLTVADFDKYKSCSEIELSFRGVKDNGNRCNGCCQHKERKKGYVNDGVCTCDDELIRPAVIDCEEIQIPFIDVDKEGWVYRVRSCRKCCD